MQAAMPPIRRASPNSIDDEQRQDDEFSTRKHNYLASTIGRHSRRKLVGQLLLIIACANSDECTVGTAYS